MRAANIDSELGVLLLLRLLRLLLLQPCEEPPARTHCPADYRSFRADKLLSIELLVQLTRYHVHHSVVLSPFRTLLARCFWLRFLLAIKRALSVNS